MKWRKKLALPMKDGVEVRDLAELRRAFDGEREINPNEPDSAQKMCAAFCSDSETSEQR